MTNGVNFSLAAGVVCIVKFSNVLANGSGPAWTLNVNSTGAKAVSIQTASGGWNYNYAVSFSSDLSTSTKYYPGITQTPMFWYDGSNYVYHIPYASQNYNDYSD